MHAPVFAGSQGGLPPLPPLWAFQKPLVATGGSIANSFGANPNGVARIAAWIVRATLLDPQVARQAALNEHGNRHAIGAIALMTVPAILFVWLGAGALGLVGALATTLVVSLASVGAMVGLLSALAPSMLGVQIPAGRLLRAIAYSQGANVVAFVPGIGPLLQLWSIVAGAAAVRAISGADTQRVAIFMVVGAVAWLVVAMVLTPVLVGALAGL
jgi:hypothetical protein